MTFLAIVATEYSRRRAAFAHVQMECREWNALCNWTLWLEMRVAPQSPAPENNQYLESKMAEIIKHAALENKDE